MPLPTPNEGEGEREFISRCMGTDTMGEDFPDQEQRSAVCYKQWRKHTGESKAMKAAESIEQRTHRIQDAWGAQFPRRGEQAEAVMSRYVVETYDTHVIVSADGAYWKVAYKVDGDEMTFAPRNKWRKVKEDRRWVNAKNALKAVSRTDDELRVGNYLILFGSPASRDLEGIASAAINADGSLGEYFTPDTDLESSYTKGVLFVDWEHGQEETPGPGDVLGVVDWKTAQWDERGVWVERVLNRRSKYVQWLESLIDEGLIGSSSEAVSDEVQKADDGAITRWPLRRDTLTVTPMEPRMLDQNHLQAFKALGIALPPDNTAGEPEPPEAEPEADLSAASAAGQGRMRLQLLKNKLTMEA
jgi:hypothetical protein